MVFDAVETSHPERGHTAVWLKFQLMPGRREDLKIGIFLAERQNDLVSSRQIIVGKILQQIHRVDQ